MLDILIALALLSWEVIFLLSEKQILNGYKETAYSG